MGIDQETLTYIIGILAVAGTIFGIYNVIRKPQEKGEVNDAVTEEKIKNIEKETESKFASLKELVINLRDNHIHTIESKLDLHIENQVKNEMVIAEKLGGIDAKLDMLIKK